MKLSLKEGKMLVTRFNPFPNKPLFYVSAVKVFWKHCGRRKIACRVFSNRRTVVILAILTHSQKSPCLNYVSALQVLWKHCGKRSHFFFFPQCFLAFWRFLCHFHQVHNCHQQTFSLKASKIRRLGKGYESFWAECLWRYLTAEILDQTANPLQSDCYLHCWQT